MAITGVSIRGKKVVIRMTELPCHTPEGVLRSPLVAKVVQHFLEDLAMRDSPLLNITEGLDITANAEGVSEAAEALVDLFRLLLNNRREFVQKLVPRFAPLLDRAYEVAEFIDALHDFWRSHERYLVYEGKADESRDRALEGHIPFVQADDKLRALVLEVYRSISSNVRGYWPRVYRQVPSGANVGLLLDRIEWPCPPGPYEMLRSIPFVRLAVLQLPVVLYPSRNFRQGSFERVEHHPLEGVKLDPKEWYCLPLKVGPLLIHTFFLEDYLGLASSLMNLFELAGHADARRKPDGMLVFGIPATRLGEQQTVFYEDREQDLVLGVVGHSPEVDYFGYFKKMMLTLHNVIMINRRRLPIHGAMCRIELRNRDVAHIVIVGDSGAGKSESLEAFRVLAEEHLRSMRIIFDDMGSLEITDSGAILGYGTEIGAFVRLDDLQPGYAFGQIDRSIFMNPHRRNARLVIPVTPYREVVAGYPVDMFLYANNYEQVDDEHGHLQIITDPAQALHVFREGYRAAKGTTDEHGLVHTYFANPFGPAQLKTRHDPLAEQYFAALYKAGVKVGQLRTRLGIPGFEQTGPESAATALFEHIRHLRRP